MKRAEAPAVLARHGIAPEADARDLRAALEARGWVVAVDVAPGPGKGRWRYHALAHRPRATAAANPFLLTAHLQAGGPTAAAALAVLLAKALAAEERAAGRND